MVTNTLADLNAANTYFGPTFIRTTNGLVGGVNANVASALPGSANVNLNDRTSVTMDDLVGNGGSSLSIIASQNISSLAGIAAAGPIAASTVNIGNNQTLTIGFNTAAAPANGTNNANFAGNIGGLGSLVKDGTSTQRLSGTNTFTGTVAVNGGVLELQNGLAIADTVNVTVSSPGTLTLISSERIGSLASLPTAVGNPAGGTVQLNGQTLFTGASASTTFNGQITGAGTSNLVKEGATTFILTGANNNYAGTTTVNGGTLQIGIAPIVTVPPTPQIGSIGVGAVAA
ncbi:MAG: autotransporter-associated beta strand repeat-containing protein [Verrucomicrobiaceae bacterium]|nr:autotransporter-associated beta strand repeat-containing protein [Verrucomicrobiaceae bacterium]